MRIPYRFGELVLAAFLLSCFGKCRGAAILSAAGPSHAFSSRTRGSLSRSDVRSLHRAAMGPRPYSSSGN